MNSVSLSGTDLSLLRRVQNHEPTAWRQFVELYGPHIFAWARRFGLSEHDAADVTQETLLSVAGGIQGFKKLSDSSSLRGWLWTIARNKTRDVQRRRHAGDQPMPDIPDDKPADTDPEESREIFRLLQRGLAQVQAVVEPRTWQAFWLVVVEGQSTADVAGQLGMNANQVRQCRSRMLRRLRDQLGDSF
jgi:RNA polymerase sigma-70 factor, ECF subfamily